MAIDTTPSTVATNALQAIPFSSLIGGPLQAAIQAQSQAAITTWEFINNVGLTGPEGDRKAISVVFQYQKGGQMVNLVVPLLAIVPIPYISIDTMTIDFTANISASSSSTVENTESTATDVGGSASVSIGYGPFSAKAEFKANYSSKKDSKATQDSKYSVEYTMNIHVGASQSAMPAGLASVLNILNSSINEAPTTGSVTISPATFQIANVKDASQNVIIVVKDSKGMVVQGVIVTVVPGNVALKATTTATDSKTDEKGAISFSISVETPVDADKLPLSVDLAVKAANVPNPVSGKAADVTANGVATITGS